MITEALYLKFAPYAERKSRQFYPYHEDVFEYITTHDYFLAIDEETPDNRVKAMSNILALSWLTTRRHLITRYYEKSEDDLNNELMEIENARDLQGMTPEEYAIEHESEHGIAELFKKAKLTDNQKTVIIARMYGSVQLKDIGLTEAEAISASQNMRKKLKPLLIEEATRAGYNTTTRARTRPRLGNYQSNGKRLPGMYHPNKEQ
jgi:hypothetical protein